MQQTATVLAARQGATCIRVSVDDRGEARRRVEFHHVARVVVGEQHGAVVSGDRTVGIVAFPRPHCLPVCPAAITPGIAVEGRAVGAGGGAELASDGAAPGMENGCGGVLHFVGARSSARDSARTAGCSLAETMTKDPERKRRRQRRPEQLRQRVLFSSSFSGTLVSHQMASHCIVGRKRHGVQIGVSAERSRRQPHDDHFTSLPASGGTRQDDGTEAQDLPRRRLTCW